MKPLKRVSIVVMLVLWAITFALAYFGVIPVWAPVPIAVLVMVLRNQITLWIMVDVLGWERFGAFIGKVNSKEFQVIMAQQNQWIANLLTEHRRLRLLQNAKPEQIPWTRSSDARLITEYGNYWAEVRNSSKNKFDFWVHKKGRLSPYDIVRRRLDCASEEEAMQGAVAFMLSRENAQDEYLGVAELMKEDICVGMESARRQLAPFHALMTAIVHAANQCKEKMRPFFPSKKTKSEAILSEMYVYCEFLYFFMHLTVEYALLEGFTGEQIEELRQNINEDIVAATIDCYMLDFPEEFKANARDRFYENLYAAHIEYSRADKLLPAEYNPLISDSFATKLSRQVGAKVDQPDIPEAMIIACEELKKANLRELVAATKHVLSA